MLSPPMLLNLVETSNADNKDLLWKFVKKYKSDIQEENFPIFDGLVAYAIKYFNDVIKSQKKYKIPNEIEKEALEALVKTTEWIAPIRAQANIAINASGTMGM